MKVIQHPSIKRVTEDGGLDSITLRSDIAARYLFTNETLLEAFNIAKPENREDYILGLKEALLKEKITDENTYLGSWLKKTQQEVAQGSENAISKEVKEQDKQFEEEIKYLDDKIAKLKEEFLNPADDSLRQKNNIIYRDYKKKFGLLLYEVRDNTPNESEDDADGEAAPVEKKPKPVKAKKDVDGAYKEEGEEDEEDDEEDEEDEDDDEEENEDGANETEAENYGGSQYFRHHTPAEIEGVEYQKGTYKRQRL